MCVCKCVYRCPWKTKKGVQSPTAGVIGSHEPPDVGAGNKILVFLRSSECS